MEGGQGAVAVRQDHQGRILIPERRDAFAQHVGQPRREHVEIAHVPRSAAGLTVMVMVEQIGGNSLLAKRLGHVMPPPAVLGEAMGDQQVQPGIGRGIGKKGQTPVGALQPCWAGWVPGQAG